MNSELVSKALFIPGIYMSLRWSDHKWTTLSTCVNAPKMHWGLIWDPITKTIYGGGLGCIWQHSLMSVNANVSWAIMKYHLLNCHPLCKVMYILIRKQLQVLQIVLAGFVHYVWKFIKAHRDIWWVGQAYLAIWFAWNTPMNRPSLLYCLVHCCLLLVENNNCAFGLYKWKWSLQTDRMYVFVCI